MSTSHIYLAIILFSLAIVWALVESTCRSGEEPDEKPAGVPVGDSFPEGEEPGSLFYLDVGSFESGLYGLTRKGWVRLKTDQDGPYVVRDGRHVRWSRQEAMR